MSYAGPLLVFFYEAPSFKYYVPPQLHIGLDGEGGTGGIFFF